MRFGPVRRLLKSQPTLLLRDGEILTDVLRRQRVTPGEVHQAIRAQGLGSVASVAAVVLETDGSFSVIPAEQAGDLTALADVDGCGNTA
ncbi:DUF421 domain-containing protein [Paractinoplanes rishiriensis]|uniref:YetF C-terminal domain-containing protein n=1 Tax=Paractinoplanes rishiriensis TaxID=1050105 RepID=A0A919MZF7_9ACTN|nr:YetF domain-containing protein [Actinoplanes rishiriensis]GIF01185.1 hypothetical protein Ari01nite_86490 [Actinoplanes rishiriensis]